MTGVIPGTTKRSWPAFKGLGLWSLSWAHGFMAIPTDNETHAKKAAALFVELWLRGVSAQFADNLVDGYLSFMERQDEAGT